MTLRVKNGKPIPVPTEPAPPGAANTLNVPYRHQEQNNWCWAGCCEMVFLYYNLQNVRQCDMATYQFGANCCVVPSSSVCNQGNWPENIYNHYRFSNSRTEAPLLPGLVISQIDSNQPIEPYYAWRNGGAHVAIIRGYYDNGDLEVNDPWYGPSRNSYSDVVTAYGLGTWSKTYFDIRRLP
ncbi:hypothetical protein A6S26_32365 [Nostoc sp. ATCC 43529]|nr:hypothetical protein A6S26_32365 [Nostoc sp. ATCC 43529]